MNVGCPECQSVFRVDPARVPARGVRARCSVCGGIMPVHPGGDRTAEPWPPASVTSRATPDPVELRNRPTPVFGAARPPGDVQGGDLPSAAAATVTPHWQPPASPTPRAVPVTPATPPAPLSPVDPAASAPAPAAPGTPVHSTPLHPTPAQHTPPVSPPSAATPAAPPPTAPPGFAPPVAGVPGSTGGAPAAGTTGPSAARPHVNPFLSNDPNQKAKRLARALVSDIVAYHPQLREQGLRDGTLKQLFKEEIKKSYEEYLEQVGKEFADGTTHFQEALNEILAGGRQMF